MRRELESGTADEPFRSIYDLASPKVSAAAIATAIDVVGVYTWDEFGRYLKAKDGNDPDDPLSKAFVLQHLAGYHDACCQPELSASEGWLQWMIEDETHPLRQFGWLESAVPDFKALYADFLTAQHGKAVAPQKPAPAPQSKVLLLLKGFVVLNYGADIVQDLNKPRSTRLSDIKEDLEQKGFAFDEKTLRRYLKDLPD